MGHGRHHGVELDDLNGGIADATGEKSVLRGPEPLVERLRGEEEVARVVAPWIQGFLATDIRITRSASPRPTGRGQRHGVRRYSRVGAETPPERPEPWEARRPRRCEKRIKSLEFKAIAPLLVDDDNLPQHCPFRQLRCTRWLDSVL